MGSYGHYDQGHRLMDKFLPLISSIYEKLTLGKTIQVILLLTTLVAASIVWEARGKLAADGINVTVSRLGDAELPVPSEKTQLTIRNVVDKHPTIVAVQVANMNFRQNTRHGVYFYSDALDLNFDYNQYQKNRVATSPLWVHSFDSDGKVNSEAVAANDRIIKIINMEFVCVPVPERVKKLVPTVERHAKAICSIGVPPYFGKVQGWVSLWLKNMPSESELGDLRIIARNLSVEIYERDIQGVLK